MNYRVIGTGEKINSNLLFQVRIPAVAHRPHDRDGTVGAVAGDILISVVASNAKAAIERVSQAISNSLAPACPSCGRTEITQQVMIVGMKNIITTTCQACEASFENRSSALMDTSPKDQ